MNTNATIMRNLNKMICVTVMMFLIVLPGIDLCAQENDSKIRIKVQTNENGDIKTFEKEYNSQEEMENDPEYKKFFGDKAPGGFHFENGTKGFKFNIDEDFSLTDSLKGNFGGNSFFFRSDAGDDNNVFFKMDSITKNGHLKFFFGNDKEDSSAFNFDFNGSTIEDLKERLEKMKEKMDMDVYFFDGNSDGHDKTHQEIIERLRDLSSSFDSFDAHKNSIVIIRKKVVIKDLEDSDKELQRIGSKKAKLLVLDDFNYYPNPSNGRFSIRFKVENETPLKVKIYSLSGREIYGESYDSFSGTFKSEIDVAKHDKGVYLLEITQGNKVLNKKLIIE